MKFKKLFVGLFVVVFAFISLFGSFINVKAEENNTLTISLTSKSMGMYEFYGNYTLREIYIAQFMTSVYEDPDDESIVLTQDGEPAFTIDFGEGDMPSIKFTLFDGVTNDDLYYEIDDEMKEAVSEEMDIDIFGDYDTVHFIIEEIEGAELTDTLVLDLASFSNFLNAKFLDYFILMEADDELSDLFDVSEHRDFYSKDGKLLVTRVDTNNGYQYNITEGLTAADNIIRELSEDDIDYINHEYNINLTGYDRLVISFVEAEYEDTDYVFDVNNMGNYQYRLGDFFRFLSRNKEASYNDIADFYEKDSERLYFSVIEDDYLDIFTVEVNPDLEYEDNIIFDIEEDSDFYEEMLEELGIEVKNLVIIFKNPEFIEGEDQEYDLSKGGELSFRLNIPFDKFQESGEVYLDGELVDPENYVATEGSTIVTFNDDFVAGLDEGDHEVKVVVMDGYATANFKIVGETVVICAK